jgi:hypothetical protein
MAGEHNFCWSLYIGSLNYQLPRLMGLFLNNMDLKLLNKYQTYWVRLTLDIDKR